MLFTYTFLHDTQLPVVEKERIGVRTMVISDPPSAAFTHRMTFELQQSGIQPVFCTMATPFPTDKSLEEGVALLRRTGAKSIISIGSGAVTDAAKAIRLMAETGARLVSETHKPLHFKESISLLSIATSVSPVHSLCAWGVLHPEDDVLVRSWAHPPEVRAHVFHSTQCWILSCVL